MRSWDHVPEELTVWTLYAITQLLLQKRSTESSLFLLSTISARKRAVRHIVHGWVILVILLFCELIKNKKYEACCKQPQLFLTLRVRKTRRES